MERIYHYAYKIINAQYMLTITTAITLSDQHFPNLVFCEASLSQNTDTVLVENKGGR